MGGGRADGAAGVMERYKKVGMKGEMLGGKGRKCRVLGEGRLGERLER